MSGAGKSSALKFMEDMGFFCVDNLPPALITKFIEVCAKAGSAFDKIALGIDARGGSLLNELLPSLANVDTKITGGQFRPQTLFLDASDETLIKRYKETRRNHPLARGAGEDSVEKGIARERTLLAEIKMCSDYIIDTTRLRTKNLKEKISEIFLEDKSFESLIITVLSFGFKYGIPIDSDLIFDVRFIPNPFYVDELKNLSGNDTPVRDFVMSYSVSQTFISKLTEMMEFLIPYYIEEGKTRLVISIGCTGGRHRSVTFANLLQDILSKSGHTAFVAHRDVEK
jgi:UPF0042 nucleotide-binding protein